MVTREAARHGLRVVVCDEAREGTVLDVFEDWDGLIAWVELDEDPGSCGCGCGCCGDSSRDRWLSLDQIEAV